MHSTEALTLQPPAEHVMSDEQFFDLCGVNRHLHIERNSNGEIVIMAPTGGETSRRNSDIIIQLGIWNRQMKLGVVFDSSGGFRLPNGANRAPDAAWIPNSWWERLSPTDRERFLPLSPLFAIELRSRTDHLETLQAKMAEYVDNGTELGWLIDPIERCVEIYRPSDRVEILNNPASVSADPILPEFTLDLSEIF